MVSGFKKKKKKNVGLNGNFVLVLVETPLKKMMILKMIKMEVLLPQAKAQKH